MRKSFFIGYKGSVEAYIYIWFSKQFALVYVGETNNINGVVGRACQHVKSGTGTLYNRLYDKGYDINDIDDLMLLSYPLPREKRFLSEETSYRISVEYLVQRKLIEERLNCNKPYVIVSNVTPGPHTGLVKIQKIAEQIVADFVETYNQF